MIEGIGSGLISLNMKDVLSSKLFTIFKKWLAWKKQFLPMSVGLSRKSNHHTTGGKKVNTVEMVAYGFYDPWTPQPNQRS